MRVRMPLIILILVAVTVSSCTTSSGMSQRDSLSLGGMRIGLAQITSLQQISELSCRSTSVCVVIGTDHNGLSSINAVDVSTARVVNSATIPVSNQIASLSCLQEKCLVGASRCAENNANRDCKGLVYSYNSGGVLTEDYEMPIAPNNPDVFVSCILPSDCVLVGNEPKGQAFAYRSPNDGKTWTLASVGGILGEGAVSGLTCSSSMICILTLNAHSSMSTATAPAVGEIARSIDMGATWSVTSQDQAPSTNYLSGPTCDPLGICMAVGQLSAHVSRDSGGTWNTTDPYSFGVGTTGACSSTSCFVVADAKSGSAIGATDNGRDWTSSSLSNVSLNGIQCLAISSCIVVGSTGGVANPVGLIGSMTLSPAR